MKNFSVSSKVIGNNNINIGIAPGKFDTKQLILSSLAVMIFTIDMKTVQFIRTVNREELAKCHLFINDDYTTMFPVIPSYHDVIKLWEENARKILAGSGVSDEEGIEFVKCSVSEKIRNLEAIDCLMDLYCTRDRSRDSFEDALNVTLTLIRKEIKDSVDERIYYHTIKAYIDNAESNYIAPSKNVQGWRNIARSIDTSKKIEYAVFPDYDGTLTIEALDKSIVMKKYAKGMPNVVYSGRFFVKVTDMETAKKVIEKLPKGLKNAKNLFA